jgi:hypothetical protein
MIIKKILPVLIALIMFLSIGASDAVAANTTTANSTNFNTSQIGQSAGVVKSDVETNYNLPNNVTVGNKQVTPSQYLYLLTTATQNIANGNKSSIALRNVSNAPSPNENVTNGTLTKAQYLTIASKITTYIAENGRLPNYVTTPLGTMEYQSLIYMYSKIMNFYNQNDRLPNTVSVQSWLLTTSGPFAVINGTAINEKLLGQESYGYVLKLGPYGNATSKNKVAVVIGVYPQEVQSHIAMFNAISYLSSTLKNMQIWIFDVVVYNGTDYTQGRAWGNALAYKYVVPQIDNSYKLLIDVHGNRGLYTNTTTGLPIPEIVMAPTSTTNSAWGPTTPTSVYQKSLSYANALLNSSYTGGTLHYYYIYSATSPPYVTLPVEAKGVPSLILDFELNISNYAQVLFQHDLGVLKALNAMFA